MIAGQARNDTRVKPAMTTHERVGHARGCWFLGAKGGQTKSFKKIKKN